MPGGHSNSFRKGFASNFYVLADPILQRKGRGFDSDSAITQGVLNVRCLQLKHETCFNMLVPIRAMDAVH